jgi:hypothetical protein
MYMGWLEEIVEKEVSILVGDILLETG